MSSIFNDICEIMFRMNEINERQYEESDNYLVERVKNNEPITEEDIEYAAKLYGARKLRREYKNVYKTLRKTKQQIEIDGKSVCNIKEAISNVDEDWLNTFFDKVRLISDDKVQQLWANILKNECFERKGGIRRVMLDRLALLDHESARAFSQLCNLSYTIQLTSVKNGSKSVSYPVPFYIFGYEAQFFLDTEYNGRNPLNEYAPDLNEIEILNDVGLVTYNMESDYADMLYGEGKTRCEFFVSNKKVYSLELNDPSIDFMLSFFVRQVAFSRSGLALFKPIYDLKNDDKDSVGELVADILPKYIKYILARWESDLR